jgi:hypothetical protein
MVSIWAIRNLTAVGTTGQDTGCRHWMATCEPGPVSRPPLSLLVDPLLTLSLQNTPRLIVAHFHGHVTCGRLRERKILTSSGV